VERLRVVGSARQWGERVGLLGWSGSMPCPGVAAGWSEDPASASKGVRVAWLVVFVLVVLVVIG
jgi:membrane protein DedA with SNARE-associated domain